jgi:hypothetical protein
MGADE